MILAILEAHAGQTKAQDTPKGVLRGAIMAPLKGEPMIWRQIERIRRARTVTKLVVATGREACDDALAGYLVSRGQTVFRGDLDDLLGGYVRCADAAGAVSHVVRLQADCPLTDPGLIDEGVRLALASRASLVSFSGYPLGLGAQIVRGGDLAVAAAEAVAAADRACPTAFVAARPKRFVQAVCRAARDRSHLDWRADRPAGFAFARAVFDALFAAEPDFGAEDVFELIDRRPELVEALAVAA